MLTTLVLSVVVRREAMALQIYNCILDVNRFACDAAVRGELWRYIKMLKLSVDC